ncbi:unnamed protein product [Prorocentrum cordatum]|uniref:Uncharacterized protein n=1 Tax=Prorocentrum cordatum TaxID=2364126 RepID=A0ABN9Q6Y4_9DINO|nr:unnamed protein product [Polarella glacialis]
MGARTVVAGDFDGDGSIDLASASKDDNTFAWYPNSNGQGDFKEKRVINDQALGAYSLFPIDVDQDGHTDLVAASNADDTVALYRNSGAGHFERIIIADDADFVLSVFAADLDNDGDIDTASASYFDGEIRWYENIGNSRDWVKHTLYQGSQGHYVSGEDLDGDGDVDLIATTTAENTVATFVAVTSCRVSSPSPECCRAGQQWNGTVCAACESGKYGSGSGAAARCATCPTGTCTIAGFTKLPLTCVADCVNDIEAAYAACDCAPDTYKTKSDICAPCPEGQEKPLGRRRTSDDFPTDASVPIYWQGFDMSLCTVVSAETDDTELVILIWMVGSLFVVFALALACSVAYRVRRSWTEKTRVQQRYHAITQERIEKACATAQTCKSSVYFIRYSTFKKHGKFTRHEVHRERGELFCLDTYEEMLVWVGTVATVFVSHQWLGFAEPDPDKIHFPAICSALDIICARNDLAETDLFLWVDYVSIPQANSYLKDISISSLGVYASIVKYFVIVAPTCIHHDEQVECNSATYQRRGWCRLEQWARMIAGGLQDMYIYEGGNLEPISDKAHWYTASVKVFEGDFTVASDKHRIVDIVLGLWYVALVNSKREGSDQMMLKDLVDQNKESVFPPEFFENYIERLEAFARIEKPSLLSRGTSSPTQSYDPTESVPSVRSRVSRRKSFENFEGERAERLQEERAERLQEVRDHSI